MFDHGLLAEQLIHGPLQIDTHAKGELAFGDGDILQRLGPQVISDQLDDRFALVRVLGPRALAQADDRGDCGAQHNAEQYQPHRVNNVAHRFGPEKKALTLRSPAIKCVPRKNTDRHA